MTAALRNLRVNAWTEWGKLRTVVVGKADNAAFYPSGPDYKCHIKDPHIAKVLDWPRGPMKQSTIDAANKQLDNLANILTGMGVNVLRPNPIDFTQSIKGPGWESPNQLCCVCPRDSIITLGNIIMEAPMSFRSRHFEYLPYREIIYKYYDNDPNMKWKAAPKPSLNDSMYRHEGYWDKFANYDYLSKEEQEKLLAENQYRYSLNENEMAFDAADTMKFGRDIFVLYGVTTNMRGIEWLRRELNGHVRVHALKSPKDVEPIHLDVNFVPLRPPSGQKPGIIMVNPDRPLVYEDEELFARNNWKLVDGPRPSPINFPMQAFCYCSEWLALNCLSVDENTILIEENEIGVKDFLESMDFKVIPIPFRDVFEFGGSIHCSTWDIEREDSNKDYFPNQ